MAKPSRSPAGLALGTVQFGLAYGVSNAVGQVSAEVARDILTAAERAGVDRVDTAAAYGESEAVLDRLVRPASDMRVVTKAPRVIGDDVQTAIDRARVSAELFGPERLDAILLHAASDLEGRNGDRLWTGLQALKAEGLTPRVGFSAYADDHPLELARRYSPDLVQVAASVFDQRLVEDGQIADMGGLGVEVHIRSIFLQGLVFMSPDRLSPNLRGATELLGRWRDALQKQGVEPARACLDFALGIEGAARLVVGVTSAAELSEILALTVASPLQLDYSAFRHHDPMILDPWRW